MNKTPTTLIIMDGFGLRTETEGNAVAAANTPRLDQFFQEYAHTELSASGLDVGLPAGQMGNSEVGHTNIGAGRVVFQDLPRISKSIDDGTSSRIPPMFTPWTPARKSALPFTSWVCSATAASTPTSTTSSP